MGEEIDKTNFSPADFRKFSERLKQETDLLRQFFEDGKMSNSEVSFGMELEACLLDSKYKAAPLNNEILASASDIDVSLELAKFNLELNSVPVGKKTNWLRAMHNQLQSNWTAVKKIANNNNCEMAMIGILPTITRDDLTLKNISDMHRYAVLNEEVMNQRTGEPLKISIRGIESLDCINDNVMMEAAATSLQLHLLIPVQQAVRFYNASLIASAATVATAANAPYLFQKLLWADSRIPLFEQAVEVGGFDNVAHGPIRRVSFGTGYARSSLMELFTENLEHFPVLLPVNFDSSVDELHHLRLHNGTIWRWNRPLIGFNADQVPHIRIEHRVMSAGPTVTDTIANAALYYGLVEALANMAEPPEVNIPFTSARDNFYQAAKFGFDAHVKWLDERSHRLRILLQKELIPLAYKGLESMDVDPDTADFYLSIIHNRVDSGGSGSNWQRQFVKETSANMSSLMEHYIGHQDSALTVDEWPIPHVEIVSSRQELTIMDSIPGGLLDISASELHTIIDGPTLIHIPGVDEKIIFISILLHGNETTGLLAIQDVLKKYTTRKLPRSIALFIGNVQAAKHGLRRLDNQSDYNRVWPGTPLETCRETILMKEVFDSVKSKDVLLSIDIHNNTGLNPHYGCITRLDPAYLHLAALFSRTMVFFTHPPGVQSMAFARLCPSVTIECGKVGSQTGLEHAIDFVDACLHIRSIPKRDPITQDIDLFHTVARVTLPEGVSCGLDDSKYDIRIQPEFEYKNFQEVEAGVIFATMETPIKKPFVVSNEAGEDLFNHYFEIHNKEIVLRTSVIPSMLTADSKIIQQDCLCYFMERFPLYR